MKTFKKASYAILLTIFFAGNFQSYSQKNSISEVSPVLKLDKVIFQEWYAGIKVGGTGINMFFPNIQTDENIQLETVYFRNMKGKLQIKDAMYSAVLENSSPHYTWQPSKKPADYPVDLKDNECVISYKQNGITKYLKVASIEEKAGTYYENGHPSIYNNRPTTRMAIVEED